MDSKLVTAGDNYLDSLSHSPEAYEHVMSVYDKFDHLVTLAVNRALEELQTPDNVIPIQRHPRFHVMTPDGAA